MRLVQLLVGDEQRDAASEALEAEGIDYLLLDESSRGTVVEFPLPSEAVEHVLDRLDEAGVDCEYVVHPQRRIGPFRRDTAARRAIRRRT